MIVLTHLLKRTLAIAFFLFASFIHVFSQDLIQPVVNCVSYNESSGTYTAYFGYISSYSETVTIRNGKENKLTPGKYKGQPEVFHPGANNFAFSIEFNGSDLTWHLDSDPFHVNVKSATASATVTSCLTVEATVEDISEGTTLPGVHVLAKQAQKETVTNQDGYFSLSPVAADDTLRFTLEGYLPLEIPVADLDGSFIQLQKEITGLEPVFATGTNEGDNLWPELYYLADQFESGVIVGSNEIFQIEESENLVLIEIWATQGADMVQLRLLLSDLGLRDEIPGGNNLLVTGWFPITNLKTLNNYDELINFVRPVFTPLLNSGLVTSQADAALKADLGRNGFNLGGKGVKIGVLSDSYDASGNSAATVVANGDLPGSSNSGNPNPVEVLADNPRGTNEGMGMLEILHDVAPQADLGFRTGFLSPGDMANGIRQLTDASYDIIVDDITYLTEPFRPTGQIAQAVDYAASNGVHYLTSAGNFSDRSYGSNFNPSASALNFPYLPNTATFAHDFGGGDIFQQISLQPGVYVMELQWDDLFYSQNEQPGTSYDLDVWIVDGLGNLLYSGNRHNTGEDPIEVSAFRITEPTVVNVMITGSGIPTGLDFQYVVFRGSDWTFREYGPNASTVVGHAASSSLSSVGAIFYGYTPEFSDDANEMVTNPYSSRGGNLLGSSLNKPDFIAADGANTSSFGSDIAFDEDNFPNFFGSSAAAPHAAGVLALVLEAYDRFYNRSEGALKNEASPLDMRSLINSTALDLDNPGVDNISGSGLINAKAILDSLANTTPQSPVLIVPEGVIPGESSFTLTVEGQYLNEETQLLFRGEPVMITNRVEIDEITTQLQTVVEPFIGNPAINFYNPPKAGTNGSDGGYSDSVYFYTPTITTVTITAVNTSKYYGEALPAFSFNTNPALSEEELALMPAINYTTLANDLSDVGVYFVSPGFAVDSETGAPLELPIELKELYEFEFSDGALFVERLPLTIKPNNQVITYGEPLNEITFDYSFGDGLNIPNRNTVLENIINGHSGQLVQDTIALLNKGLALVNKGLALVNNTSWTISDVALNKGLALVNSNNAILVEPSTLEDYQNSPSGTLVNKGLALVNNELLANGEALISLTDDEGNVIGNKGLALVNKGLALVNKGLALVNEEGSETTLDKTIMVVSEDDTEIDEFSSINFITGLTAAGADAPQYIVPGAFYSSNFLVNYEVGELVIEKAELVITANDTAVNELDPLPAFTSQVTGFITGEAYDVVFDESAVVSYSVSPNYDGAAGIYEIIPSITEPANYYITSQNGILYVNPTISGEKIKVQLECHEHLINDPSGNKIRAYFSYYNKNNVPWYLPEGKNNQLVGITNYSGELPKVFLPGFHIFTIEWNGDKMNWQVYSTAIDKTSFASSETANSQGCTISEASVTFESSNYSYYPNPTQDYLNIDFTSGSVLNVSIAIYDQYGFPRSIPLYQDNLNNRATLDFTTESIGTYFVLINMGTESSTIRVKRE